jgi:exonuclease V
VRVAEDEESQQPAEQGPEQEVEEEQDEVTGRRRKRRKDTRTPIQRFRARKPLSVTDIISPAWCELQYWYNLTKFGKVRQTKAMKQGSGVHKVLEEQVHRVVPVDVKTKEDRFGLRMWNIIQGLRTLRRTGMTREMEVWGLVDGEVVNGVIDQITTLCPDEELEEQILPQKETEAGKANGTSKGKRKATLPSDQRTLKEYLTASHSASIVEDEPQTDNISWLGTLHHEPSSSKKPKTLYIIDVKTRQSRTLPSANTQLRPTHYQLMMYHRLFSTLAANGVPAERIFERYNVDPARTFSDRFLAQMSEFEDGFEEVDEEDIVEQFNWSSGFSDHDHDEGVQENVRLIEEREKKDPVTELLEHNTLGALWGLMVEEFSRTVTAQVSPLLTAEFRTPRSGNLIGRRSFLFDPTILDSWIAEELKFWRGQREAKGVEVEEAFKCQSCEFAENCEWRKTNVEEGVQKARLRREARSRKSEV